MELHGITVSDEDGTNHFMLSQRRQALKISIIEVGVQVWY
jgi:hypothetical protein